MYLLLKFCLAEGSDLVLDALHPNFAERVERKQQGQKAAHDTKAAERSFQEQDSVYMLNIMSGGADKMQGALII